MKITLVTMGVCECALSLILSSLLPSPSGFYFFLGGGGDVLPKPGRSFTDVCMLSGGCMRDVLSLTLGCFSYITRTCCALFAGLGAPHSTMTWPVWCSLLLTYTE